MVRQHVCESCVSRLASHATLPITRAAREEARVRGVGQYVLCNALLCR